MCLKITKDTKLLIAEEDIVCYKVLEKVEKIEFVYLENTSKDPFAMIVDDEIYFLSIFENWTYSRKKNIVELLRSNPIFHIELQSGKYLTPHKHDIVEIGVTYNSCITTQARKFFYTNLDKLDLSISEAIHSYVNLGDCRRAAAFSEKLCVVKCIIPKNSAFYVGKYGESDGYASSSIKYVEVLK